jgi:hypothetical protein
MAKRDDLILYITRQIAEYIDTPREVRKQRRQEGRGKSREPWAFRWFGMLPVSLRMWLDGWKRGPGGEK